jgi:tetratricopeptide (TPR) repeat protein/tRNA A-37 threonylcarbamoyl transferase component Bud32
MREGQVVSNYRIMAKLGRGGMGVVYKAEDTVLKRTVALKFFLPEVLGDEEARTRLIREARAASVLDHPNVCTVHEVGDSDDEGLFICMGYCEGKTLRERLKGPLPGGAEALDIAIQVAEGLGHAHGRGIIHRDIKPENIAISPEGRVRIMDFGLAKLRGESAITKTGGVAGTLAYMSPEQVKGLEVDHRSDIWSLGVVLYELLTGKTPFGGLYEAAALYSIINEKPTPPSEINPAIPGDTEAIVLRALEKRPESRYQSMKEVVEDLKRVQSEGAGEVQPALLTTKGRSRKKSFRRRVMIAALVSIAVAASTLFVVDTFRVDADPISVAVLDFKNDAGEEGLDRILAGLLTTDLAQSPNVRVLSRDRMLEIQNELNVQEVNASTGCDMARQVGVQVLVSGEVVKMGKTFRINASVFDVNSKELLFAKYKEGNGPGSVFDMIDDLSRDIRKELRVVPRWGMDVEPSLATLTTKSLDAYRLFSQGEDLRNSKPEEAVALMEQAVAQDTTFAEAYMELALLYNHQLGDRDKALECALRAKELSKNKSPKEYLKSLIYESWVLRNWDGVKANVTQYLELQPNDMRIKRRLGWVLARDESTYDEAIAQFTEMIEQDPNNISGETSSACNHLGNLYMYMGRFDEAIAAFESYKALAPASPAPLHSIGNAYMFSGRYDEAVRQYSEILKDDPRYFISYESLGMTYMAMGKWRDALNAFRRYLAVAPAGRSPEAHIRMASVYYEQGEFVLANEETDEALLLNTGLCSAHWTKGLIALASEGTAGARAELAAIEKLPENQEAEEGSPYLHHLAGRIRLAEGKGAEGVEDLRMAVKEAEREDSYFFKKELVKGCLDAGLVEDAIREGSQLLTYNPNDGELLALVGFAYGRTGDVEAKNTYLGRALKAWKGADRDFLPLKDAQAQL